jgi:hypothetical protein
VAQALLPVLILLYLLVAHSQEWHWGCIRARLEPCRSGVRKMMALAAALGRQGLNSLRKKSGGTGTPACADSVVLTSSAQPGVALGVYQGTA